MSEKAESDKFLPEWKSFLNEVTVAGVKYVANADSSWARRLFWFVLVLFGICLALYQIIHQTRYFISNPTTTVVSINNEGDIPFPTVTICNENIFSLSKANIIDPTGTLSNFTLEIFSPIGRPEIDEDDVSSAFVLPSNMSGWYEFYQNIYMDVPPQVFHCTFKGANCTEDMYTTVLTSIGNCYQFNPHGKLSMSQTGLNSGLEIILECFQDDYLSTAAGAAGYRVNLHHYLDQPLMDTQAFLVNVNQITDVQIINEEFYGLPSPYGECQDSQDYLYYECYHTCQEKYLLQQCGCTIPSYSIAPHTDVCDPYTLFVCITAAIKNFATNQILKTQCTCPKQCHEIFYPQSISSAQFSELYIKSMQKYMLDERGIAIEKDDIQSDFVDLDIYYSKLETQTFNTQPAYSIIALFCDVGGAMGLILGSTIITLFEFADFFLIVLWKMCKKDSKVKSDHELKENAWEGK